MSLSTPSRPNPPPETYWYFFNVPQTPTPLWLHQLILIATPMTSLALLTPPHRLGRNLLLGCCTIYGTFHLRWDWTGQTFWERVATSSSSSSTEKSSFSFFGDDLPPQAKAMRERLARQKQMLEAREAGITTKEGFAQWLSEKEGTGKSEKEREAEEKMLREQFLKDYEESLVNKVAKGEAIKEWRDRREKRQKEDAAAVKRGESPWGLTVAHAKEALGEMFSGKDKDKDKGGEGVNDGKGEKK